MGKKRGYELDKSTEGPNKKSASVSNILQSKSEDAQALNFSPLRQQRSTSEQQTDGTPYNGRPSTLPLLPAIQDSSLALIPFTHAGTLHGHSSTKVETSYDRLELLGDAYIELIATRLVFSRFPKLSAGRLSQLREKLVKNDTLAEYALAYSFDEKGRLPGSMKRAGIDNKKLWTKTLGDIFEAYVAAIILSDPSHGFQVAEAWLKALWENKLATQPTLETQTGDPDAKGQLAAKVLGRDIKLNYRDEAPPHEIRKEGKLIFHIGVYLTGWGWENLRLGTGKGLSKQDAGFKAAADALANPLTAQVASVKRAFDLKRSLERDAQLEGKEKDTENEQQEDGG